MRAEKVDLKHVDTNNSEDVAAGGGGKESKTSSALRRRGAGEKGSPRAKKQVYLLFTVLFCFELYLLFVFLGRGR